MWKYFRGHFFVYGKFYFMNTIFHPCMETYHVECLYSDPIWMVSRISPDVSQTQPSIILWWLWRWWYTNDSKRSILGTWVTIYCRRGSSKFYRWSSLVGRVQIDNVKMTFWYHDCKTLTVVENKLIWFIFTGGYIHRFRETASTRTSEWKWRKRQITLELPRVNVYVIVSEICRDDCVEIVIIINYNIIIIKFWFMPRLYHADLTTIHHCIRRTRIRSIWCIWCTRRT